MTTELQEFFGLGKIAAKKLNKIAQQIKLKEKQLAQLQKQFKRLRRPGRKGKVKNQIISLQSHIRELKQSEEAVKLKLAQDRASRNTKLAVGAVGTVGATAYALHKRKNKKEEDKMNELEIIKMTTDNWHSLNEMSKASVLGNIIKQDMAKLKILKGKLNKLKINLKAHPEMKKAVAGQYSNLVNQQQSLIRKIKGNKSKLGMAT